MITKKDILTTASSALTQAIHSWLHENRQPILHAVSLSLASAATPKPKPDTVACDREGPYLTMAEVAKRWRCCVHTVQRKIRAGELPRLVLNKRHILIPIAAVLKFEKDATIPGR